MRDLACPFEIGNASILSPRENDVVLSIANGETANQAGEHLHIKPRTVNHHAEGAMNKTGARNRQNLVALCFSMGILRARVEQRGSVALSALWLMISLTLCSLVLDNDLRPRYRHKPRVTQRANRSRRRELLEEELLKWFGVNGL
jgi:DNA-binding CsgD family transcriptional regulator